VKEGVKEVPIHLNGSRSVELGKEERQISDSVVQEGGGGGRVDRFFFHEPDEAD